MYLVGAFETKKGDVYRYKRFVATKQFFSLVMCCWSVEWMPVKCYFPSKMLFLDYGKKLFNDVITIDIIVIKIPVFQVRMLSKAKLGV